MAEKIGIQVNLLAFDTSYNACSIALSKNGKVKVLHEVLPRQQAQCLLPMIQALLLDASLTLNHLDAVAYACGPGSFTGIRIASSVAQGLGLALTKPIIQLSSLALLAQAAFLEKKWEKILVAVDARMQQIYWAKYVVKAGIVELLDTEQLTHANAISLPQGKDWYGVGDGWEGYAENLIHTLSFTPYDIVSTQLPTADALMPLMLARLAKKEVITPKEAIPTYLR